MNSAGDYVDDDDDAGGGDDDDGDGTPQFLLPSNAPSSPLAPLPPPPPRALPLPAHPLALQKALDNGDRMVLYENIWTGGRVQQRPEHPAGPSEACVVSQVPRPMDPLTFLTDPVKRGGGGGGGGGGADGCGGGVLKMVRTPSWSFSTWKSKGYEAAAECLSKCMDA